MYQCVFTSSDTVLENLTKQTLFCLIKYYIKGRSYCYLRPHSTDIRSFCQPPFTESHNTLTDTTFSGTITFKRNTVIEYNITNIRELLLLTSKEPLQCKGVDSFPLIVSPSRDFFESVDYLPRGMTEVSKHTSPKSLRVIVTHH